MSIMENQMDNFIKSGIKEREFVYKELEKLKEQNSKMLEMLKELIEAFDYKEDNDSLQNEVILKAKQVIKKATEL